jgi:HK97 family phage major capsid protein
MRTAPTGDQVIALFGDLRMSTHFGLRSQIAVRASTDRYIEADQTFFSALVRFDIITSDIGDGTTAGPVVSLKL